MAVYVITYDLNAPGQDYGLLIAEMRRAGAVRYQKSAWLIESAQTAVKIRDVLQSYIDANDLIFVAEITSDADWAAYAMVPPSGDWLKARRP